MKNNKGFTLAELLIVVAIIGVLVAVAIPVFTSQLEKSRESVDLANVRSAYAQVMVDSYSGTDAASWNEDEGVYKATVPLKQRQGGWKLGTATLKVGDVYHDNDLNKEKNVEWVGDPSGESNAACEVTYNPETNKLVLNWGGEYTEASKTTPVDAVINGLGQMLTRLNGWGADSNGLMSIGGNTTNESASKATLTTTPIALSKGATVTITAEDGYQNGYFLMKWDEEKGGFVKVVDSGWKSGTINFTVDDDGYYLVTNTKKTSGNITAAEAGQNAKITIANNNAYSTTGLTASSLSTLSNYKAASGKGISNSTSSKTGGTISETSAYYRGYVTADAKAGQILSISSNENAKYAYFFTKKDGTVLYDSGWLNSGDETAIVVPQDCQVVIQVQGDKGMTDERLASAMESVSIYSK